MEAKGHVSLFGILTYIVSNIYFTGSKRANEFSFLKISIYKSYCAYPVQGIGGTVAYKHP